MKRMAMTPLRRACVARGLRTVDIGKELDKRGMEFSTPTIRNWIRGFQSPSPEAVPPLAEILGITPMELINLIQRSRRMFQRSHTPRTVAKTS